MGVEHFPHTIDEMMSKIATCSNLGSSSSKDGITTWKRSYNDSFKTVDSVGKLSEKIETGKTLEASVVKKTVGTTLRPATLSASSITVD